MRNKIKIVIIVIPILLFMQCFKSKSNMHLNNAVKLLNNGFYYEAGIELNNAAEILEQEVKEGKIRETQKEYLQYHFLMAMLYQKRKEYKKAIQEYEKLKIIDNEEYESISYFGQGAIYMQLKKYKKAIIFIKKGLKINPNYLPGYFTLGSVFYKLKDYNKAIKNLDKVINKKRTVIGIFINKNIVKEMDSGIKLMSKILLGNIYIQKNNYERAIEIFNNINLEGYKSSKKAKDILNMKDKFIQLCKELKKGNNENILKAANLYIKIGNYQESINLLKKCINKSYKKEYILYKIGECYYKLKDYKKAKKYLLSIKTTSIPRINKLLGLLYKREGNIKKALEEFKLFLLKNPYDKEVRKYYKTMLSLKIDLNENSNSYFVLRNIGLYYLKLKKYNRALVYLKKAKKFAIQDTDKAESYNNIGVLNLRLKKYKKAELMFNKGLEKNRISKNILFNLSIVYAKMKRYKKSIKYLKYLIKLEPNNSRYKMKLGYYYLKDKDIDNAVNIWKELVNNSNTKYIDKKKLIGIINIIG